MSHPLPFRSAISTGAFGYPFEPATDVAISAVRDALPGLEAVRHIRFVLFSRQDLAIYEEKLKDFFND